MFYDTFKYFEALLVFYFSAPRRFPAHYRNLSRTLINSCFTVISRWYVKPRWRDLRRGVDMCYWRCLSTYRPCQRDIACVPTETERLIGVDSSLPRVFREDLREWDCWWTEAVELQGATPSAVIQVLTPLQVTLIFLSARPEGEKKV